MPPEFPAGLIINGASGAQLTLALARIPASYELIDYREVR